MLTYMYIKVKVVSLYFYSFVLCIESRDFVVYWFDLIPHDLINILSIDFFSLIITLSWRYLGESDLLPNIRLKIVKKE